MAKDLLDMNLDKSIFVRCSNWDAEVLTDEQVRIYESLEDFLPQHQAIRMETYYCRYPW